MSLTNEQDFPEITLPDMPTATVTLEEAKGGKVEPSLVQHSVQGNKLTLSDIALGTDNVARIFVVTA